MAWPSARSVRTKSDEQREGVVERLQLGDLAADMHVDAGDRHAGELGRAGIDLARAADRNAELVLGLPVAILAWVLASTSGLTRTETCGGAALARPRSTTAARAPARIRH